MTTENSEDSVRPPLFAAVSPTATPEALRDRTNKDSGAKCKDGANPPANVTLLVGPHTLADSPPSSPSSNAEPPSPISTKAIDDGKILWEWEHFGRRLMFRERKDLDIILVAIELSITKSQKMYQHY